MIHQIDPHQHTLQQAVSCCGVGLHTGKDIKLTINPAPAHTGIQFLRSDLAGRPIIPARVERIVDTTLATTIGDGQRNTISTTEHLLASLRAFGIDNAVVELDSYEVPIMDGSAEPFVRLLQSAGRCRQQALRKILKITRPISLVSGDKSMRIEPYDGYKITARIRFDNTLIGEQRHSLEVTPDRFAKEIARARTFGFAEQVEYLWEKGLSQGGTLDNVVVIHWDRHSILNEGGLRFDNEFIRHKMLDIIGDIALLGSPVMGHVIADLPGHGLHQQFMEKIVNSPQSWEYVTLQKKGTSLLQKVVSSKQATGAFAPFFAPINSTVPFQPSCAM
jgi:UDP-3-O-[3-hydroxymyristoyl] N-acetylglucosamine deacetylase